MDAEHVDKAPEVAFNDLHPTPTARGTPRGIDLPPWGGSDGKESKFIRCKQCGFLLDRDKTPMGSGWGNVTEEIRVSTATWDDAQIDINNSVTTYDGTWYEDIEGHSGCPFCGASEYE